MSFFFFQAEDGIRDLTVTGVQTCALPISPWCRFLACSRDGRVSTEVVRGGRPAPVSPGIAPWQCLYFRPLPQGQGSLRPTDIDQAVTAASASRICARVAR